MELDFVQCRNHLLNTRQHHIRHFATDLSRRTACMWARGPRRTCLGQCQWGNRPFGPDCRRGTGPARRTRVRRHRESVRQWACTRRGCMHRRQCNRSGACKAGTRTVGHRLRIALRRPRKGPDTFPCIRNRTRRPNIHQCPCSTLRVAGKLFLQA